MVTYLKTAVVFALTTFLMLAGCGGDSADDTTHETLSDSVDLTPEEELNRTLKDIIALVESGDVKGLFEKYTPPARRLKTKEELDVAIDRFEIFKPQFLEAMKASLTQTALFNEDSTKVTYESDVVPGGKVRFQKIDNQWYFSD